jgi:hypothetical protein
VGGKGVTVMEGTVRRTQIVERGNKKKVTQNPNLRMITEKANEWHVAIKKPNLKMMTMETL